MIATPPGMSMERSSAADWEKVDLAADPKSYVRYLDNVQRQDAIRSFKRQTFEMLDLQRGQRVLEVGCGAGDDAQTMAHMVAPTGRVIGIDSSNAMIAESERRSRDLGLPVEFKVGDAHSLEFASGWFHRARADRVFQHLEDPERALAEMLRVTRSGGRIVVADTDWGTLAVDSSDPATTTEVLKEVASVIRNPWMGRELFGIFGRAGLEEVTVSSGTAVITDYGLADNLFHLSDALRRARESGTVTERAATDWWRCQQEAAAAGRFCSALSGFIVAGRCP